MVASPTPFTVSLCSFSPPSQIHALGRRSEEGYCSYFLCIHCTSAAGLGSSVQAIHVYPASVLFLLMKGYILMLFCLTNLDPN